MTKIAAEDTLLSAAARESTPCDCDTQSELQERLAELRAGR